MAKKIFVSLLVLMLAGPIVATACHCCSSNGPLSGTSLTTPDPDCCSAFNPHRENSSLTQSESPIRTQEILLPLFAAGILGMVVTDPSRTNIQSKAIGPPFFSSETPLYLAQQILRL